MEVKNISGTSNNTCNCESWLEHWERFGGQSISKYCSEKSCRNKPEIGAHVQKTSVLDKNWYIVPLCKECNKRILAFELVSSVKLVSANATLCTQ